MQTVDQTLCNAPKANGRQLSAHQHRKQGLAQGLLWIVCQQVKGKQPLAPDAKASRARLWANERIWRRCCTCCVPQTIIISLILSILNTQLGASLVGAHHADSRSPVSHIVFRALCTCVRAHTVDSHLVVGKF